MQQRLTLSSPAGEIATVAVVFDLCDVSLHREPSANLPIVFRRHATTEVVATVPLEPASGICRMDPTFLTPDRERLTCVHAEEIERRIVPLVTELRILEPISRKFVTTIRHVFPAEHTE